MYQAVAPMLLVDDVDQAIRWYEDALGAKLQYHKPTARPLEWASLRLDDVEIMIARKQAGQSWYSDHVVVSDTPANFIAYVYVADVDSLNERVRGKAIVTLELADQPYGIREFAVQDPFGFVWVFA
ncbi:MAG: hypothetical protein AMJ93_08435 [Anaerolineae bacterium SM23_84]|nr:MAG: hypothetical protein AMJ93_08435 [Anaerolineae bacterium SM23_84]